MTGILGRIAEWVGLGRDPAPPAPPERPVWWCDPCQVAWSGHNGRCWLCGEAGR